MAELDPNVVEFLVESRENLDQLDQDLVAIEEDPGDAETLGRIFRTIHTIKGTCGFLAFPRLEAVSHAGENLLCRIRDGEISWDATITSALLALVDAVRRILDSIEQTGSEGDGDHEELIARFEGIPIQALPAERSTPMPESPNQGVDQETLLDDPIEPDLDEESCTIDEPSGLVHSHSSSGSEANPTASEVGGRGLSSSSSTIRVDVGLLDKLMNLVGELVLARNQILQSNSGRKDTNTQGTSQRLNLITTELQEGVMKTRMQPIGNVWSKFPRVVRDLAMACGKQVRIEMEGKETELDKTIIEAIKDPLTHVVRNAIDHGIETPERRRELGKPAGGRLRLRAYHESGHVNIEISDDGSGLDPERIRRKALERGIVTHDQALRMGERELINLVFLPGFSTAEKVTHVSGRGVGMDIVKTNLEKIGGTIDLQSWPGKGTTLKVKIPLTLAIIPALIVTSDGDRYAIPQVNLLELVRLEGEEARRGIEMVHGAPLYRLRGQLLPLIFLDKELGGADGEHGASGPVSSQEQPEFNYLLLISLHSRWIERLDRLLKGREEIDEERLGSDLTCDLGRWLASEEARRWQTREEFAQVVQHHREFHLRVRELVQLHQAGKIAEASAALTVLHECSRALTSALHGLERLMGSANTTNIVILQADDRQFGLVVEGINDTEEIVVKPLSKQLKGLSLFAGATIMGDGRVALILDVTGFAQRTGVISGLRDAKLDDRAEESGQQGDDRQSILLFGIGAGRRMAIPLSQVARLEEIPRSDVEWADGREVVQYRGQIMPLVCLADALGGGRAGQDHDPMQVIVYARGGRSVGLVVSEIFDIVSTPMQLQESRGFGLLGSAIVQQRVIDLIDVTGLIRSVDPEFLRTPEAVGA